MTNYIKKIQMTIKPDEKGYLDRQCPNTKCEYIFKINMDDWENKIKANNEAHCPMCGYIADSEHWFTNEQISIIKENIKDYTTVMVHEIFNDLARNTRNNKYIKIRYKPSKRVTYRNSPIGQREEWNLDIVCEKCGTRYSVIGSAYFCPCCGYNSVERVFDNSISRIEKMLESQNYIKEKLCERYTIDEADNMCRLMLESLLGDIVSAFQKFVKENLIQKSIQDTSKIRVNDFQMVERGSILYEKYLNRSYDKYLSKEELNQMNILFQKRHVLEHNQGIIDDKYIQNSRDTTYEIGQRIVVKKEDIEQLLFIIKKLTKELRK